MYAGKKDIPANRLDVKNLFQNFRFAPDGNTSLADTLCSFIKEEIAFGRLKGGERIPTMREIAKATGLSFGKARGVVEQLAREGYVHSRTYAGTVVLARGGDVLRGRVLVAVPGIDVGRFYRAQLVETMRRKLSGAGYAFSVVTFPLHGSDGMAQFKLELLRATDLVIAMRATPEVQKCIEESGVPHVYAFGDKPQAAGISWIRFCPKNALAAFAGHCARARVKRVVQVRFEDDALGDAQPMLAKKGIECSWLTIPKENGNRWVFESSLRQAYETFAAMPRHRFPDLLLFWSTFLAQGALTAFLARGIRMPDDVKAVVLCTAGLGPVYPKSFTRFEIDPAAAGEKVADFALAVMAKGRIPRPPLIESNYVFGHTFPF